MKVGENTGGSSVPEEVGSNNSRRKQKVFPKQQSSIKQRFFSSNFRNHGTGRNSHGVISESPPSNSVGFFFASTPPENHGSVQIDCFHFFSFTGRISMNFSIRKEHEVIVGLESLSLSILTI